MRFVTPVDFIRVTRKMALGLYACGGGGAMAKATLQDWRRTVETGLRAWMASAELPLDLVMAVTGVTRQYLNDVALCVGSPAAPKEKPDPEKKAAKAAKPKGHGAARNSSRAAPVSRADVLLPIVLEAGKEVRVFEIQRIAHERGHQMTATQISTVLKRAADRGLLVCRKSGKNFFYKPAAPNGGTQLPLREGAQVQES